MKSLSDTHFRLQLGLLILFLNGGLNAWGSDGIFSLFQQKGNVWSYSKWMSIPAGKDVSIRLLRPLCAPQERATKAAVESLPSAVADKLKRAKTFMGRTVATLPPTEVRSHGLLLELKLIDVLIVPGIPTITTGLLGGAAVPPGMLAVAGRLVDADEGTILVTFEDTRFLERIITSGGDRAYVTELADSVAEDIAAILEERKK